MSFFDPQRIQEYLLRCHNGTAPESVSAVGTDDDFEDAVLLLRDYSFIEMTRDVDTFKMHSLVQLATRTWLENEGQLDKWRNQFIINLRRELPQATYENWKKCGALFPHARTALIQRPRDQQSLIEWFDLLYNAAAYAWQSCKTVDSEQMSVAAMEVAKEVFGERGIETLETMRKVGHAKELAGKLEESETICRQTLGISEKVLGHEHPMTLADMKRLVQVLEHLGKHKEAEAICRQTLLMLGEVLEHRDPRTLDCIVTLAWTLQKQSEYEEAEKLLRHALSCFEDPSMYERPGVWICLAYLISVVNDQGKDKEAEEMYRQTLTRAEKLLGPEHRTTLFMVLSVAKFLEERHHFDEVLSLFKRAHAGHQSVYHEDHIAIRDCVWRYDHALMCKDLIESGLSYSTPMPGWFVCRRASSSNEHEDE